MSDSLYLAHPTSEMTQLRQLLAEQKYFPSHRTWERQMFAIPATLPAQIYCEARHLVSLNHQWASGGHREYGIALARRHLASKTSREGEIPHTSSAMGRGMPSRRERCRDRSKGSS